MSETKRELLDQQEVVQVTQTMADQITALCGTVPGLKRAAICRQALAIALPGMLKKAGLSVEQ